MERKAVAVHYLYTWFVMDLIASLPLDLLLRGRRLDILRLPRLLKIIRMMHYKSFSQAGKITGTHLIHLIYLGHFCSVLNHIVSLPWTCC